MPALSARSTSWLRSSRLTSTPWGMLAAYTFASSVNLPVVTTIPLLAPSVITAEWSFCTMGRPIELFGWCLHSTIVRLPSSPCISTSLPPSATPPISSTRPHPALEKMSPQTRSNSNPSIMSRRITLDPMAQAACGSFIALARVAVARPPHARGSSGASIGGGGLTATGRCLTQRRVGGRAMTARRGRLRRITSRSIRRTPTR